MSASILDRLNARIAAEPSLDHLDTLFSDLQDARDAIVAAVTENTDLKDRLSAPPEVPKPTDDEAPAVTPSSVTQAITLLRDGKARLEVHALSDVGLSMDGAIKVLGG